MIVIFVIYLMLELFEDASIQRKYLGFRVFTLFVSKVNTSDILILLSPKFVKALVHSLRIKNNFLLPAALDCV